MTKIELAEDIANLVQPFLDNLSDRQRVELFGQSAVEAVAYQSRYFYSLVIGPESDIAACDERALRTGSPFPGVRVVAAESGGIYVDRHGGALWVEGGGTIAGGLTVVGLAPDADVGLKNIVLRRGGARGYRVGWAFIAAFGQNVTSETMSNFIKPYLS